MGPLYTVDLRAELRISIDGAFVLAPVITLDPVGDQFLKVGGIGAVLPTLVCEVVGPARELETCPQIIQHFIRHFDAKRFHVVYFLWSGGGMRGHQCTFRTLHGQ
jgi:hypothetical protein